MAIIQRFGAALNLNVHVQALELAAAGPTPRTIAWTLDGYNALAPYYNRTVGATRVFFIGAPPMGHIGPPWAGIVSFAPSPWADFLILTNTPCFAHIALL